MSRRNFWGHQMTAKKGSRTKKKGREGATGTGASGTIEES